MRLCLFFMVATFLIGCTPKTSNSLERAMGNAASTKIGNLKGKKATLSMSNSLLKAELLKRFNGVTDISDIKVVSNSPEYYYLTAKGMKDGMVANMAAELTLMDLSLQLDTYNKLNHLCFGQYCDGCSFKFNDKGEISGCACDTGDMERPEGMAQCGYTMSIATLEKRF